MTSTGGQQQSNPAPNAPVNASAPSYASAAGAAKKSLTTPVVATGFSSNAPLVAAGSSVPAAQHAKSNSVSPVNGRPSFIQPAMPQNPAAAPAVVHGTSSMNGANDSHARKPSVTINGNHNMPPMPKNNNIQFGFQSSPAPSHSTPQLGSAPIAIPPRDTRVNSPQHSPQPIPQPSASGGRPPSSAQQGNSLTFGSFGGNGDSHMRRPSGSQDPAGPNPHGRNNSQAMMNDPSNQGHPLQGGPSARGAYPGRGGRGGGYNAGFQQNHQQMGYPPNNNQFRGPPQHGRGGMAPSFQPGRPYGVGTPPQQRASPALPPAMPAPNPAMHNAPYYYQPPSMGQAMPQVPPPPQSSFVEHQPSWKHGKRKNQRSRDGEKFPPNHQRADSFSNVSHDRNPKARRNSKRLDQRWFVQDPQEPRRRAQLGPERGDRVDVQYHQASMDPPMMPLPQPTQYFPPSQRPAPIDLSPESGNFERMLTQDKQYYPGGWGPGGAPPMPGYPMYSPMGGPQPHSPAPGYQQPFAAPPPPFVPPGSQSMSRSHSQMSEQQQHPPRPASSTSQNQVSQGTPRVPPAQTQPVVVSSTQFARPTKKNAAITIKSADGVALDLSKIKTPASPSPSIQQAQTPPVVASTPTPPPKPATPKTTAPAHTRTDSMATKTREEVQNELKEKIARQIADGSKGVEDDSAKAAAEKAADESKAAEEKAAEEFKAAEKAREDERLKAEQKAKEKANEEAKAAEEAKAKEEAKLKAEAEAKAKEEAEAKTKAEVDAAKASEKKEESAPPAESEEDEMERMIREMEEAEAKREAAAAEYEKKRKADAEIKKKADEGSKKASAADNDRKMREAEAEAERLEEEKERRRQERETSGQATTVSDMLTQKIESLKVSDSASKSSEQSSKPANLNINNHLGSVAGAKTSPGEKRGTKPPPLNLNTTAVEPPQPSAALQSLKTARLLRPDQLMSLSYPAGISGMNSPNPALNAAVSKKGTSFKYDPNFLLQFKTVFTEQPSMEFHQQVKSLIGDDGNRSTSARTPAGGSGRQNSRPGAPGFAMGSFNAPPGRTLPPGTTSQDRFEMSKSGMGRPPIGNPMASFSRPGGAFPGGNPMSRTPSTSTMGMPNSPRQGSRSTRNASKRDTFGGKSETQAAKTMPLTAGMKIEALPTSSTGWKPTSISQKPAAVAAAAAIAPGGLMDPAMVQRKVKAALNKMTPENFDRISDSILNIAAQSKDESDGRTLRQVIQLTFEKATDEAHWASMYAKFCKKMLETMSPEIRDENILDKSGNVVNGGALFRKYLLNRCQEEFERGWKTNLPKAPEDGDDKTSKEAAMLSDEYYIAAAAKRRGLGLVQFIGELYKLGMLTERIMHECVKKLVDYNGVPDEAEVESLSKLLRTIGAHLDATDKGHAFMDIYFQRIQNMMDLPDLPSRLRFMLLDVIDLRKARWVSKEQNKGPKTLDEIRAEAEAVAAQKAAEAARSNQRGPGGRSQMGRGDARQFSGGYPQPVPNQVGMDDLRRLKGTAASRTSNANISLGPTSMFASRSSSGRRLGPGGSLSRGAEDSGASSRTGTPPTREPQSTNAFSLLANMEDNPASPPSTAASPALAKVQPDTTAAAEK